jgi:hypothetical protein
MNIVNYGQTSTPSDFKVLAFVTPLTQSVLSGITTSSLGSDQLTYVESLEDFVDTLFGYTAITFQAGSGATAEKITDVELHGIMTMLEYGASVYVMNTTGLTKSGAYTTKNIQSVINSTGAGCIVNNVFDGLTGSGFTGIQDTPIIIQNTDFEQRLLNYFIAEVNDPGNTAGTPFTYNDQLGEIYAIFQDDVLSSESFTEQFPSLGIFAYDTFPSSVYGTSEYNNFIVSNGKLIDQNIIELLGIKIRNRCINPETNPESTSELWTKIPVPMVYDLAGQFSRLNLARTPWSSTSNFLVGPLLNIVQDDGEYVLPFSDSNSIAEFKNTITGLINNRINYATFYSFDGIYGCYFLSDLTCESQSDNSAPFTLAQSEKSVYFVNITKYIKNKISSICENYVFELNNEITRLQLTSEILTFMNGLLSDGAINNFNVVADDTNNTFEDRINRRLKVDVAYTTNPTNDFVEQSIIIIP